MIHADGRKSAHQRALNDVGGIQVTAHAGFQHHVVAVSFLEIFKGDGGLQFENGRMVQTFGRHSVRRILYLLHKFRKFRFSHPFAVNLKAFQIAEDGRGAVAAHSVSRIHEDVLCVGKDGALSVGARNVDNSKIVLRVIQLFHERSYGVQAQDNPGRGHVIQVFPGFGVIHFSTPRCVYLSF